MPRESLEVPRYDPGEIPAENAERQDEDQLSVFEWYCPDCEAWLGWPDGADHTATVCADAGDCTHGDEDTACGHVACGDCGALADSHEWLLEGDAVGWVARCLFEGVDIEAAFKRALVEDLQQVAAGKSAEEVIEQRKELFARYAERVAEE